MSKKLAQWDKQYSTVVRRLQPRLLKRREFLCLLTRTSLAGMAATSATLLSACTDADISNTRLIRREPWATFSAVQGHLFPADGNGPGAEDINATRYLKFVLEAPDTDVEQRDLIDSGPQWLNEISRELKGEVFINLSAEDREHVIKQVASSRVGESWLSYLLLYIFEALLTDPVYGGNPDGMGWKWLQHAPGFPRPPFNKRYTELL